VKYRSGFKYQLAEREIFYTTVLPEAVTPTRFLTLTLAGMLTIEAGYAWDGASGPTFDTKSTMRPSLYHDAMYQLIRLGALRRSQRHQVDDEFGRLLKEDGMWGWRRKLWIREVKKFGSRAADPKDIKPIHTAP
jgi:hypothetical protein